MAEITLGQYYPENSIIHKLDPRVKLFGTLIFIIAIFSTNNIIGLLAIVMFLAIIIKISKVPFAKIIKGIKGILFLLVFNVPHILVRYLFMFWGYKLGAGVLDKIQKSGLMESLTYGAAILGLMVIGGMTAEMVAVNIPLSIGSGDSAMPVADILNGIVPGILSLGFTGFIYMLLGKGFKTSTILVIIALIGILGAFFGVLA